MLCSFAKPTAKFKMHSNEPSRHRPEEAKVGPQSPHALFGGDWVRCIGRAFWGPYISLRCRLCAAQDKSDEAVMIGVTGKRHSPRYSFPKSSRFTATVQQVSKSCRRADYQPL